MDKGEETCFLFWKKCWGYSLLTLRSLQVAPRSPCKHANAQDFSLHQPWRTPDHHRRTQLSAAGPPLGMWMPLSFLQEQGHGEGQTGRKATGQGGKPSAGTEAWQTESIFSPWSGLDYTFHRSCKDSNLRRAAEVCVGCSYLGNINCKLSCQCVAGLTPLQEASPQDRSSTTPLRLGHEHILMLCGHEFISILQLLLLRRFPNILSYCRSLTSSMLSLTQKFYIHYLFLFLVLQHSEDKFSSWSY